MLGQLNIETSLHDNYSCHSARRDRYCDNYNLNSNKYVCITTKQPDTKSNPNPIPNPNPNPTTKQHAIIIIQLTQSHGLRQCCCAVCTGFDSNVMG